MSATTAFSPAVFAPSWAWTMTTSRIGTFWLSRSLRRSSARLESGLPVKVLAVVSPPAKNAAEIPAEITTRAIQVNTVRQGRAAHRRAHA